MWMNQISDPGFRSGGVLKPHTFFHSRTRQLKIDNHSRFWVSKTFSCVLVDKENQRIWNLKPTAAVIMSPEVALKVARFIWLPQSGFCNILHTYSDICHHIVIQFIQKVKLNPCCGKFWMVTPNFFYIFFFTFSSVVIMKSFVNI